MRGRSVHIGCGVLLVAAVAAGCGGSGKKASKPRPLTQEELVNRVSKGTVQISGREGSDLVVGGTGIVVDRQNGYVLTAAHVVEGTSSLKVRYGDADTAGEVIGAAPCDDVAVIKMDDPPAGLRNVPLGSAANIRAGQQVTALGFPISLQNPAKPEKLVSVNGSVSVTGATDATPDPDYPEYTSVIQHQAPITHGNSGGPLVNTYGRLVGMNVLINPDAPTQSYAITIDHIKRILPGLESGKDKAYVGWDLQPVPTMKRDQIDFGWNVNTGNVGVGVLGVDPGSPASARNIQKGDYIERVNDTVVSSVQDVCDILKSNVGRVVKLKMYNMYGNPKGGTVYPFVKKVKVR